MLSITKEHVRENSTIQTKNDGNNNIHLVLTHFLISIPEALLFFLGFVMWKSVKSLLEKEN